MANQQFLLKDNTNVNIRPLRSDDIPLLQEMHRRLSPGSVYYRYLRAYTPTLHDWQQICQLQEQKQGAALVAATAEPWEKIMGLAYYVINPAYRQTAEPAILVEDRFQGLGLGRILFHQLSRLAQSNHVHTFDALVHAGNQAILRLIQGTGYPFTTELAYGTREVRISLQPAAPVYADQYTAVPLATA